MLVGLLLALAFAPAAEAEPPFGLKTFSSNTVDAGDLPYTVAGGHLDLNETEFSIPRKDGKSGGVEDLNGAYVTPPRGFIVNPAAAPRCPFSKISAEGAPDTCPSGSQIGIALVTLNAAGEGDSLSSVNPLYNVPPEHGYSAQFGFQLTGGGYSTAISAFLLPRTESYGLTVGTPSIPAVNVTAFSAIFFGTPSQHGSGSGAAPFLSNPVNCSEAEPRWSIAIDSAQHAGALRELGVPDLTDPDWKAASDIAPAVTGCDGPALAGQFDPGIATKPLQGPGPVQADQPTGLAIDLEFPQSNDPTDPTNTDFDPALPQAPEPKDITVKLPAGLAISPSSADGLQGCSDQASDPAGDQVHYDNTKPVTCPDSAKIGSATATTPLLAAYDPQDDSVVGSEPILGSVYLLKPHPGDLPIGGGNQDGKFRLLIELENPRYGINIKLPGTAIADKQTGQLTTVFIDNPQLPASHLTVNLKSGPRAPLASPVTCGNFTTTSNFVPWSTPGTPNANPTAGFNVGPGPGGSGCAAGSGQRPFSPTMSAGTESSAAGQSSSFVLQLARNDGEGELSSLQATLPKGLAAKFTGIPYCSDAALAAAAARSGKAELANPSCPASRIGSVTVGAGPGTNPFNTQGTAYLAGPYKGAPMSVAVITPAAAGPFDLGTVVVRNALYVDPKTAQGRVVSDPLPKILDGISLKLRSIDVDLDRPGFALNPTSCEARAVTVTLTSTDGAVANPTNRFQAKGCEKLRFKPKLALHLLNGLARNRHPVLRAVLRAGSGEAAIAAATVTLPAGELLDLHRLPALCARELPPELCPPSSRLGEARVWSPLLSEPLEGPIYLRAPSGQFPDLLADLRGAGLHFVLHGRTSAPSRRLRIHFPDLPDTPFTKAQFTFAGGRRGVIVNSEALCGRSRRATVDFSAHNNSLIRLRPLLHLRGRC